MTLTVSPARIVEDSRSPLLASPASWPRRELGEVADILNGYAFKSQQFVPEGGLPLIRIRDIFGTETAVSYVGEYEERYLIRLGELLVGMDGDFNCARWAGPTALLNQRVCKVSPNPAELDLDYLSFVLPAYLRAIRDHTSATTVAHLSSRDLAKIPMPVPSLTEQRALAAVVGSATQSADRASTRLNASSRTVERFRQTVLAAAFTGRLTSELPESNNALEKDAHPPSWQITKLEELAEDDAAVSYGIVKPGPEVSGGVPYVRQQDVAGGTVLISQLARTSAEIAARHRRSSLREGDVLLCIIRNLRVALVPAGMDGANITQGMVRIRARVGVSSEYLALYLESPRAQRWMQDRYVGLAMPRINVRDARQIPVPLPPEGEQQQIVRRVSRLLALADEITASVARATREIDRTSQAVLAKALRGAADLNTHQRPAGATD